MTLQRFIGANEKQTVSIFKVISTSNLLATNKCWQTLKEKFDLSFGEYGNVTSALFSGPDYGLIIVIFLEDLVQGITFEKTEIRESQTIFIESIKEKAKASTKPIIICFGSNLNQSVIEGVKGDTDLKKFHNWYVEQLNLLRDSFESIYFMNLGDTFYKYGAVNMFSQRNWYFGRCRLSIDGLEVITHKLALVIDRIKNSSKKVLVLDCDNTLWGGVIGEDGLGGLTLGQDGLGQAFIDFQKEIVRLTSFWLDTWLSHQYSGIKRRYIIHDATAREVDQDTFYRTKESGGTLISSAYKLAVDMINSQFPVTDWNTYLSHFLFLEF